MNICAKKRDKVIVTETTAKNGYEFDSNNVKKYLEVGKEYTVEDTIVDQYHTTVYLQEIPQIGFNSVNFEDINEI